MIAIIQEVNDNLIHTYLNISYEEALDRIQVGGLIPSPPDHDLSMVVIIPAFAEYSLRPTINSLLQTGSSRDHVELIILINESEDVSDDYNTTNVRCFKELKEYKSGHEGQLTIHVVYIHHIPRKIAGVGTARKLAMDEAARRLKQVDMPRKGIIINLDADCTVSSNYFTDIRTFFQNHPKIELANIHFEHRLEDAASQEEKEAIINYEVHLRYFIGMQRHIQLPYAFQTIGSAFAVRADAYLGIGGMNRRKAGEDFYFIHKFTKKGTAAELNTCTVYPSSRSSFRVPFGTGRAVSEMIDAKQPFTTYHPQSFLDLIPFVQSVESFFNESEESIKQTISTFPKPITQYLHSKNSVSTIIKLKANSKSVETFKKAFFQWFDAFQLMKYLHYARDFHYLNLKVEEAISMAEDILQVSCFEGLEKGLLELRLVFKK